LTSEEIKQLAMTIKSKRVLKALAISTSLKCKDMDQLKKLNEALLAP